jgi:hypothetical protein
MKTKALLCCAFLFGMSTLMHSQNQSDINELLSRLHENHMGAVSDVFSLEEQLILRGHFDALNPNPDFPENGGSIDLFGPNNTLRTFNTWSLGAPELFTNLGPSIIVDPDFEGAGAWDYGEQHFTGISNNNEFFEVSVSGNYSSLGTIDPPPGENFVGGAYHPGNNSYYALSTDGVSNTSTLTLIDKGAMTATPIGNTGIMLPINLAIDMGGLAFAIDLDSDILVRINLTTAAATPVGPIGFDSNFGQGMSFDMDYNRVFYSAFNADTFRSELRIVDTNTGATTLIGPLGSTSPGGTVQVAWLGIPDNQLGINDFTAAEALLFPNPVKDELHLRATSPIDTIVIYNLLGQELQIETDLNSDPIIDISYLKAGAYIMKVTMNGQLGSYKFIKQ